MIYDCLCLPSCLPEPEYILHPLPPLLPVYTILYRVPLPASSRSINQFITQPASDPPPIEIIVSPLLLSCHQARRKSKHICSQQQPATSSSIHDMHFSILGDTQPPRHDTASFLHLLHNHHRHQYDRHRHHHRHPNSRAQLIWSGTVK